jgi:hypothetical protein
MHFAPQVRVQVSRSRWLSGLVGVFLCLAALQVTWFLSVHFNSGWRGGLVALSFIVVCGIALTSARQPKAGQLFWSGASWHWTGFKVGDGACKLQLHLDFQFLMLVSLHCPGMRAEWLWLPRSPNRYLWLAMRRAMVHSASQQPSAIQRVSKVATLVES